MSLENAAHVSRHPCAGAAQSSRNLQQGMNITMQGDGGIEVHKSVGGLDSSEACT